MNSTAYFRFTPVFYGGYLAPGLIHLDKQEDTGYREIPAPPGTVTGTCRPLV